MYCANCGTYIKDEIYCPNCGTKTQNVYIATTKQSNKKDGTKKIKRFINNNKKTIGLIIGLIVITLVSITFVSKYLIILKWDNNYSDSNLEYVTQSEVKLGIKFNHEDNIEKLKYKTNCGEVTAKDLEINWNLTKSEGECKLTVSYKNKNIIKEYKVIPFNVHETDLSFTEEIDLDSDEDLDFDTLTNKQEKEFGTNPLSADTDFDGLDDDYEINTSKTDANIKDTDKDGLNDFDEIELGLNPLLSSTFNDGIKDGDRELTYNFNSEDVMIELTGTGNIASIIASIDEETAISSKAGMIDKLYTFHTEGTVKNAKVIISYTQDDIEKYELNEDNLAVYYYNTKDGNYEKVDTVVDKDNKTLTVNLKHFSNYIVADSTKIDEKPTSEILFILDNSWSMYTNEQFKNITGEEYHDVYSNDILGGYDKEGMRFTLTSELISRLDDTKNKIGLAEFRDDYKKALSIGSSKKELNNKLSNMNGKFITATVGTDIDNALTQGIKAFSNNGSNKFIVILTDGEDSYLSSKSKSLIAKAIKNNVSICAVGFGGGAHNDALSKISTATGCNFFSSTDVDGLIELLNNVENKLNGDLVDIDGDNVFDGRILSDSGFIVNKNGFSFENYGSNLSSGGHCYGMATFAQLYYINKLPLKLGEKTVDGYISSPYDLTKGYFKDYSNLYDYKLKTNELKYSFGYEHFGEVIPSDFRALANNALSYNKKYKDEILNTDFYDYETGIETSLDANSQMKKYGFTYETYDEILLNETKMQTSKLIDSTDKSLFNAIYAGYIKQKSVIHYASTSNFVLWVRDKIGTETIDDSNGPIFMNILKGRLDNKDVPVITTTFSQSGGLHAVNAISLVQNLDNPNYYYIGVYDNNYPGEKRYLDVECKKDKCYTQPNMYYNGSDNALRISTSIEEDLNYYK